MLRSAAIAALRSQRKQSEPATAIRHVTGARHAPTAGGPAHTNTPDGDREVDAEILVRDAVDSPLVRTR